MFHKINKLQNDVDEMLDLCAETDEESTEYQDLGVTILKAQDGELGKRAFKKLQKLLTSDNEALRYYIDFQMLTAMLRDHFDKGRIDRILNTLKEQVAVGSA